MAAVVYDPVVSNDWYTSGHAELELCKQSIVELLCTLLEHSLKMIPGIIEKKQYFVVNKNIIRLHVVRIFTFLLLGIITF